MVEYNKSRTAKGKTTAYLKKNKSIKCTYVKVLNVHTYIINLVYFIFRRYVDWYFVYELKSKSTFLAVHVFSNGSMLRKR